MLSGGEVAEYGKGDIISRRRSYRVFSDKQIDNLRLSSILVAGSESPSSCNRQAIYTQISFDNKLLDELLVGGKNWVGEAPLVLLLWAAMEAYKSPFEKEYMPYLDAGFFASNMIYRAETLNIGTCFINPQVKKENINRFNKEFRPGEDFLFCGAVAFGYSTHGVTTPEKKNWEDLII